jgi:sugar transferase (PEP-CTERM system associated)
VKLMFLAVLEATVFVLAVRLGLGFDLYQSPSAESVAAQLIPMAMFGVGVLFILNAVGLYSQELWKDAQFVRVRLLAAAAFIFAPIVLIQNLPPSFALEPGGLAITLVTIAAGIALVRFVFYRCENWIALKPRVLVLGTGSRVAEFSELAKRNGRHLIVGYVPVQAADEHYVPTSLVLPMDQGESLLSMVKKHDIDQIVIAVRDRRGKLPVKELVECKLQGVKITELPTAFEREYRRLSLESISASWIMLEEGFRQGAFRSAIKRLFDLGVSSVLLLLASPVILVTALCIVAEDGFPVLYRQERVGQRGRVFAMYKLRSMRTDAERDGKPRWASAKDDRTTRVGRIIRKLRIDELPQIINVFKGQMSFVGPRPERPFFVDKLVEQIPYYAMRHSVKPGITGWAQVCYPYGASLEDAVEKLRYDLYYVKNHALFLDLVILFATIEVVICGKGAR